MIRTGDRIELLEMPLDPCPIKPGTCGTVRDVVPMGQGLTQAWVDWDDGRALALCMPPDKVRLVEQQK